MFSEGQCFLALDDHGGPLATKMWAVLFRLQSPFSSLPRQTGRPLIVSCASFHDYFCLPGKNFCIEKASQSHCSAGSEGTRPLRERKEQSNNDAPKSEYFLFCSGDGESTASDWGTAASSDVMPLYSEKESRLFSRAMSSSPLVTILSDHYPQLRQ